MPTVREVLAAAESSGLSVELRYDCPMLVGDKRKISPELMELLRSHRQEIIDALEKPGRQWLWLFGQTSKEPYLNAWDHPTGAWWFREHGEPEWRLTPMGEQHKVGRPTPTPLEKPMPPVREKKS